MKLLFHTDAINERGVARSTSIYIKCLEEMGFHCQWAFDISNNFNNQIAINHYGKNFDLLPYKHFSELVSLAQKRYEWVYFQKSGERDGKTIQGIYNAVHAVFSKWEPHGDRYAYISQWLARTVSRFPDSRFIGGARRRFENPMSKRMFVPYTIDLNPSGVNVRRSIAVPESAFMCIAIGGRTSFDIPWVQKEIIEKIETSKDFYFVGINIEPFFHHKRASFLNTTMDEAYKFALIESADVFIHGRTLGESFGLSLLEAMQLKIPIISWRGGRDRNHISLLDESNFYRDRRELSKKLTREYVNQMSVSVQTNSEKSRQYRPVMVLPHFLQTFEISKPELTKLS